MKEMKWMLLMSRARPCRWYRKSRKSAFPNERILLFGFFRQSGDAWEIHASEPGLTLPPTKASIQSLHYKHIGELVIDIDAALSRFHSSKCSMITTSVHRSTASLTSKTIVSILCAKLRIDSYWGGVKKKKTYLRNRKICPSKYVSKQNLLEDRQQRWTICQIQALFSNHCT